MLSENNLDYLDITSLLLNNYKYLGFNENQLVILFFIIYLKKKGKKIVSLSQLAEKMQCDSKVIDFELDYLIKSGIITIVSDKKNQLVMSLDGLFEKLDSLLSYTEEHEISIEEENIKNYNWLED